MAERKQPVADLIPTAEAARRLGVKPATLYSYVSRGLLRRYRAGDGRASLFDSAEVASLRRRGRAGGPDPGGPDAGALLIRSAITEIRGDGLRFRGLDALRLAGSRSFEDVAGLLWSGFLPGEDPGLGQAAGPAGPAGLGQGGGAGPVGYGQAGGPAGWHAAPAGQAAAAAAQAALPAGVLPLERLQIIVPALAIADPLRLQLSPPAVMAAGRGIIGGMVDCLPVPRGDGKPAGSPPPAGNGSPAPAGTAGPGPGGGGQAGSPAPAGAAGPEAGASPFPADTWGPVPAGDSIAARLWRRLCPGPAEPALLAVLQSALVLLADHELAASTVAARVAASVRADPYAVVATGLGAASGAMHGGAALGAETMLAAAREPADAPWVVADVLRRGERIPGLGHFVYPGADPRAEFLLAALRRAAPGSPRLAVAEAVLAETAGRGLPRANIDFVLAAFTGVAGMIPGAGQAIFAVARTAGWVAHALEAYAEGTPLRPRAGQAQE